MSWVLVAKDAEVAEAVEVVKVVGSALFFPVLRCGGHVLALLVVGAPQVLREAAHVPAEGLGVAPSATLKGVVIRGLCVPLFVSSCVCRGR
jgi:hypothetical protein